jgi:hypothetical protein
MCISTTQTQYEYVVYDVDVFEFVLYLTLYYTLSFYGYPSITRL